MSGVTTFEEEVRDMIALWREPGALFVNLFCDPLLAVLRQVPAPRLALTSSRALMNTLRDYVAGKWTPPRTIPFRQYLDILQKADPQDPMTASIMFGYFLEEKRWTCRPKPRVFKALPKVRGHFKANPRKLEEEFACLDYRLLPDPYPGMILYCDLAPEHTQRLGGPRIEPDEFWGHAAAWHRKGARVFVAMKSLSGAPSEWIELHRFRRGLFMEHILVHRDSPMGVVASAQAEKKKEEEAARAALRPPRRPRGRPPGRRIPWLEERRATARAARGRTRFLS